MARSQGALEPGLCHGGGDPGLRRGGKRFGIPRLIALVHPEHVASRRVAEHIGMRVERTTVLDGDYPAVVYAAELSLTPNAPPAPR